MTDRIFHALTGFGTVVCGSANDVRLSHRPLAEADNPAAWCWSAPGTVAVLGREPGQPPVEFAVTPATRRPGLVQLFRPGGYFTARPDGSIEGVERTPGRFEEMLLVPEMAFQRLLLITTNAWAVARTRQIIRPTDIALLPDFAMRAGPFRLDLLPALPFGPSQEDTPLALTLFRDGWKVEDLRLLRPLIYYTVSRTLFGQGDYTAMLALSIASYARCNTLPADILVIGNLDPAALLPQLPEGQRGRVHILPRPTLSLQDVLTHRFEVGAWAPSRAFQPIVFLDADVLVNNDLSGMFAEMALSPAILVTEEPDSPMTERISVGAPLLAEDPFPLDNDRGFNAGSFGFANLALHGRSLEAAREVMRRYALAHGADRLPYADQCCANYVWTKLGLRDGSVMRPYVTFAADERVTSRTGLVHFWGSRDRLAAMQRHMALLAAG